MNWAPLAAAPVSAAVSSLCDRRCGAEPGGLVLMDLAALSSPVSPRAGPRHLPAPTPWGGGRGAISWDAGLTAQSRTGTSPTRERGEWHRRETCRDAPSEAAARPCCCLHRWRFAQVSLVQDVAGPPPELGPGRRGVPAEGLEGCEGMRQRGTVQSEGPALAPGGLSPALRSLQQGTARGGERVTMSTAA